MLGLSPATLNAAAATRNPTEPTVTSAIRKASLESGSSFELMMASAQLESGFRPDAKASSSSAAGLFQFTEQTWLDTVRRHGAEHGMASEAAAIVDKSGRLTTADPAIRKRILSLRSDLSVASAMAGDHLRDLSKKLSAGLGRAATAGEVYLGHFLGEHGAKQIITSAKNQIAANLLPEAARANSSLFYAPNGTPYTAGQFLQHIQKRLSQAFANSSSMPGGSTNLIASSHIANISAAPSTGLSGQATGIPQRIQSSSEMLVMAALVEPLTRSDQLSINSKSRLAKLESELPAATLTALQTSPT